MQEKKLNIDFQDSGHGGHLGFLIRMILAIFDLQVTLMLPTKFRVMDFWVQKKRKIDFQDSRHLGFIIGMILAILFLIYKSPKCFLPSFESTGLSVQEKKRKIDFQDGCHGAHPGFTIGMILAIFDLQVTPMPPTKFGVNWLLGLGVEAKNRFSRWRPSWISDWHDFSYF